MRIGIHTWGSEGDIRPFVALGAALSRRGHAVDLIYTEIGERRYEAVATSLGFTARAIASPVLADPQRMDDLGWKLVNTRNPLEQGLIISKALLEPIADVAYEAALEQAARSDLLIQHFILHPARAAADKAGTPQITVTFQHMMTPSRFICPQAMPCLGEWGNVLEWRLARFALNQTLLKDVNRFRTRAGLPRFADLALDAWPSHRLNLLASSPAFLDRPSDWPAWHQLCGFLELPSHEHESTSPDVDQFLGAGTPPVFMGFGSLMPEEGSRLLETVAVFEEAARIAGCRAIIQADVEKAATDRILYIKRTPHKLVFPRCAAVVHHCGAGTTHATLRAGAPSIPVPHVSDQFAWAGELRRLGAAPRMLRRNQWSANKLASRISEVLHSPRMKESAVAMSARMKDDNGPETASDLIESLV
ncbi:MAG: glycosyltransferase [Cyanobacteria bacterium]|nr:glycosyltransferase [Cyanobacteriota bacterium]